MMLVQLFRVGQWSKNLFLFLPIFFSGHLFELDRMVHIAMGFLLFSMAASSIYILNDVKDIGQDRLHPEKSKRPIPAGKISVPGALSIGAVMLTIALVGSYWLSPAFFFILVGYVGMNIGYTLYFKQVSVIDVAMIATGFTLRVLAGGTLAEVLISHWILIMTFLLAFFLGLAKRRDDVLMLAASGKPMRKSLTGYNIEFIQAAMVLMAGVVVVAYLMYTLSEEVMARFGTPHLYATGIFVLLGILRYFQLTLITQNSGNPTRLLLKDRPLQFILLAWIISFYLIIYVNKSAWNL